MKSWFLLLTAALLCTTACELFEDNISFGHPHKYSQRYGRRTEGDTEGPADISPKKCDTVVYVSAVRIPEGYDWQRDTAYGAVDAELVLFRNFKETLRIPVNSHVSAAADKHFIAGGHLYTEQQHSSCTYIGRDGQELLSIPGREELKGILEKDGILYLLTSPIGKEGFTLRAGSDILMMKNDGTVFGDLLTPSYRPGGALYMNNGKCCFCYASGSTFYKVEDGEESVLGPWAATPHDLRLIGQAGITANDNLRGYRLVDARIWPIAGDYAISGTEANSDSPIVFWNSTNTTRMIPVSDAAATYVSDGYAFSVVCSKDGKVSLADSSGSREIDGSWYFFSPACATAGHDSPAAVLTPRRKGEKPIAIYNGRNNIIDINGFLTGIAIETEEE